MEVTQSTSYLSIGSNIGDCIKNIDRAIELLNSDKTQVIKTSLYYESEPWGFDSKNTFINCCIAISTKLSLEDLLNETQSIERIIGRTEKSINAGYSDRIIDIDILFYGNHICKTENITIPHPYFQERNFVLIPLTEIAPNFINPKNNLTITQHLTNLKDNNTLKAVKKS